MRFITLLLAILAVACVAYAATNTQSVKLETNSDSPVEPIATPKPVQVCSATGDPHYHTFDGKDFNMYGIGDYYLVKRKPEDGFSGLVIQTKTKKWGAGSANVALAVQVNGNKIVIEAEGKKVNINDKDVIVVDQVSMLHGAVLKKISENVFRIIARDGSAIETRIGHEKFSYMDVHIYLRDSYKGKISGLCGNWDGNIDNDGGDETGTEFAVEKSDNLFPYKDYAYANTDEVEPWKDAEERTRAIRLCRSVGAKGVSLINCVNDYKRTRDVQSVASYRYIEEDVNALKDWVFEQRAVRDASSVKGECKTRLAKVLYIARKQRAVIEQLKETLKKTAEMANISLQEREKEDVQPVDSASVLAAPPRRNR